MTTLRLSAVLLVVAAAVVALLGLAGGLADKPDPQPNWRIEWHGTDRYLWTEGRWHVWSAEGRWVAMPREWAPRAHAKEGSVK